MDFSYSPDQDALRSLARKMLSDHATPQRLTEMEDREADGRMDRDLWKTLADGGLTGVVVPEAQGGSGLGIAELAIVLEEIGRAVAPVPAFATLALGALPIARHGSRAQQESLLPGVVDGSVILSAALQEPGSHDPLEPVTTATADGAGYRVTGEKFCVPAAGAARVVLVPATIGADIAILLVDPNAEGVTLEAVETTSREIQFNMTFDGVAVPATALLGTVAGGREILADIVRHATVALCAMQAGVVDRAVRMTAEYATTREQFERPLAAFQAVSQRAANAYIDAEAVRLSAQQAVWRLSEGLDADAEIATAKFFSAEAAQRAVLAAQHLHGGVGVDLSYPLHRYFIWAKEIELTLGGGTRQLLKLGDMIAAGAV